MSFLFASKFNFKFSPTQNQHICLPKVPQQIICLKQTGSEPARPPAASATRWCRRWVLRSLPTWSLRHGTPWHPSPSGESNNKSKKSVAAHGFFVTFFWKTWISKRLGLLYSFNQTTHSFKRRCWISILNRWYPRITAVGLVIHPTLRPKPSVQWVQVRHAKGLSDDFLLRWPTGCCHAWEMAIQFWIFFGPHKFYLWLLLLMLPKNMV